MRRVRVKPSKIQSLSGFLVGLLFCLIGLFIVIPRFGAFGIVWTVVAGAITATSAINAFSDKGVATHEIVIEDERAERTDSPQAQSKGSGDSIRRTKERLQTARELYEKGLINADEYEKKKAEILQEL